MVEKFTHNVAENLQFKIYLHKYRKADWLLGLVCGLFSLVKAQMWIETGLQDAVVVVHYLHYQKTGYDVKGIVDAING